MNSLQKRLEAHFTVVCFCFVQVSREVSVGTTLMTAPITTAKMGVYAWMVWTRTIAAAHLNGQVRTMENIPVWAGHTLWEWNAGLLAFTRCTTGAVYGSVQLICDLFCSLGGRCHWNPYKKIVFIKATTIEGNFPLHQAVLQAYVHMGLTDRYCDSWAAMQHDCHELHFRFYRLLCKRDMCFTKVQSMALLLQVCAFMVLCWYILRVFLTWDNNPCVDNGSAAEDQGKSERRHRWGKGKEENKRYVWEAYVFATIIFLLWLIFIWSSLTSKATFAS